MIWNIGNDLDKFVLAVAYANGTRVGELSGLRVKDIDYDADFVYITTPVLKKRGKIVPKRAPPISRLGEPWLTGIILGFVENKEPGDLLIPYSKRTIQYRIQRYADCTSHSFRHTRATHMLWHFKMNMEMVKLFFRLSPSGLASWIDTYGHLDTGYLKGHYRDIGMVKKKDVDNKV